MDVSGKAESGRAAPAGGPAAGPAARHDEHAHHGLALASLHVSQLLSSLYDAVLIVEPGGRIAEANQRALRFLLYTRSELLDLKIDAIVAGLDARLMTQVETHLSDGRFTVLDAYCYRKDRTTFPSEIAISRVRLPGGDHFVFSVRNMEWRKHTLEKLRAEHNAIQHCVSAILMAEPGGRVRYANPAFIRMWGFADERQVVGRDIRACFADAKTADEVVRRAVAGESWQGELEAVGRSGRQFYVQVGAAANRDGKNNAVGLVFSFVDITDRRKAEEAIRKEAEAQIRKAREQDDFSGMLHIISVPDVMQLIDAARKSGRLTIYDDRQQIVAEVGFLEGRVVSARCGTTSGEGAVYELLQRGGASFLFRQGRDAEKDPSISRSTMSLLLEGSRVLDEAQGAAP